MTDIGSLECIAQSEKFSLVRYLSINSVRSIY